MICNVSNGFCGAYAKHVDNRCNLHFDGGRDVKKCPQRLLMNRLEKEWKKETTTDAAFQFWTQWKKEKEKK